MPSSSPVVLITGATGYIGGSVLSRLLDGQGSSRYDLRAIVRDADKAKKLIDQFGVNAIIGSLTDKDLLEKEASKADVVLAIADVDDLEAAEAINKGLKKRFEATGKRAILIHTSGAGVLADKAVGDYSSDVIYDDENIKQLATLPDDAFHRPPELAALRADRDGYAKTYIVSPGIIYGKAHNPLVGAGIANERTLVFKIIVTAALQRGTGITIGKAQNIWPNVHIDELTDLYLLILSSAMDESKDLPHGEEGYFLAGADEHKNVDVYGAITKALFELGKTKNAESTQWTDEEATATFGAMGPFLRVVLGSNARLVANRARKLGWKPSKTTKDYLDTVKDEVEHWASV